MDRNLEQISKEYAALAQKAGHIAYQVSVMETELEQAYDSMRTLNIEASKLQKKDDANGETAIPSN